MLVLFFKMKPKLMEFPILAALPWLRWAGLEPLSHLLGARLSAVSDVLGDGAHVAH